MRTSESAHDPPWVVPFVKAIILSHDRRTFLLQHRIKRGDLYEGFWELPGGRVQVGESLLDCLRREVQEEAGLSVTEFLGQQPERIVDRLGGTARLVRPLVTVEVEEHSIFGHYFACVAEPGAVPRASAESDRHRWITPAGFRDTFLSMSEGSAPEVGDTDPSRARTECSTVDLLALRVAFRDGLGRWFE